MLKPAATPDIEALKILDERLRWLSGAASVVLVDGKLLVGHR